MNNNNKAKVILGYILSLLGLIFYYADKTASNEDKKNYAQGGTIFIILFTLSIINIVLGGIIPFLGLIIGLLDTGIFVLAIIAAVRAADNNFFEIPVIYDFSQKIFK